MALDNLTINSYNRYLHETNLLRNMIPASGLRYLLAALNNYYKNYDTKQWHYLDIPCFLMSTNGLRELYYQFL